MLAARTPSDMRMAIVGSPAYLEKRALPKTPQHLSEYTIPQNHSQRP
jgi:hypothetical protein